MEVLLVFGFIIALLAALDVAALRWGVNSRDGFCDDVACLKPTITV